ncbi:MAG: hypothetical protein ACTSYA_02830 [Candidatus Kariarchaeaceae archaeon]
MEYNFSNFDILEVSSTGEALLDQIGNESIGDFFSEKTIQIIKIVNGKLTNNQLAEKLKTEVNEIKDEISRLVNEKYVIPLLDNQTCCVLLEDFYNCLIEYVVKTMGKLGYDRLMKEIDKIESVMLKMIAYDKKSQKFSFEVIRLHVRSTQELHYSEVLETFLDPVSKFIDSLEKISGINEVNRLKAHLLNRTQGIYGRAFF